MSKLFGIGVMRFSETTADSLKVVTQPALTVLPPSLYTGVEDSTPFPFLQCKTTWSHSFTLVTPGPTPSTTQLPSCPRRCGRNLSGPLTPSISLICEPHSPL